MARYEPRLLTSKIAKRYADLLLVKYDLEQVHDCCQFLLNQPQDLHLMLAKAVTDSALIRYRRCFNSGVRVKLSDLVETLSTSERELHQLVLDQANNHVAHSANDYEQAVATVHIAVDTDGLRRSGVGAQISMWPPLSMAEIVGLQSLSKALSAGVRTWSDDVVKRLNSETDKMSDHDLLQLKYANIAGGKRQAGKLRNYPPPMDDDV